jgi:hypothetical protein
MSERMRGYVYPLTLNGYSVTEGFDIGGRPSRELESEHLEGLVTVLGIAAERDSVQRVRIKNARVGELRAWLELIGASEYLLHVETPYGDRAVLGPIRLDANSFETAGKETYFDGAQGRWRLAFANPFRLNRQDTGVESFGPLSIPAKPLGPEVVVIRVERPDEEPRYFEHTVNARTDAERDALVIAAARFAAGESAAGRVPKYRTAMGANHQFQVVAMYENEPGRWAGTATFTMPVLLREVAA